MGYSACHLQVYHIPLIMRLFVGLLVGLSWLPKSGGSGGGFWVAAVRLIQGVLVSAATGGA
jgi:hypothetical protein